MCPPQNVPPSMIMALENKKLEVAYEKQVIELMVRYQLEILLIGLREETLSVVSNTFVLDCLRIGGVQQL